MEETNKSDFDIFTYIQENNLGGIVIAVIGLICLIAVIMDADWMLEANRNGRFNIGTIVSIWGRKAGRIIMGTLSVIIILSGLAIWWLN